MAGQFGRSAVGLAAEYAVASELCRRGVYAQLTLGHQKKTDILLLSESGEFACVEVKSKMGPKWPGCKGISGRNAYLVFVDYQLCKSEERPAFFVLSVQDWCAVLNKRVAEIRAKNPKKRIRVTENMPVFVGEIGRGGKPYQGLSIQLSDITAFRERWDKITLGRATKILREPTTHST